MEYRLRKLMIRNEKYKHENKNTDLSGNSRWEKITGKGEKFHYYEKDWYKLQSMSEHCKYNKKILIQKVHTTTNL